LFAAPPALWFSLRGKDRWSVGLWVAHFLPALVALFVRTSRFVLEPSMMRQDILSSIAYELTYPGNLLYVKTYVVYFMTFVSALYYLLLSKFTQSSKVARTFLGLLTVLSFTLFYPYLLGDFWETWRPFHRGLTVFFETVVLAYTFYIIVERYRGMYHVEQELNAETSPNLLTNHAFGLYLEQISFVEKRFLREDYTMDLLVSDSGFSAAAWRTYFKSKNTTFLVVKKRMRIDHATQLIIDGYLDHHTVEALTSEIGYASRSTFYTAFQEIKGKPFPQYLQELRNS
jgi:AraC-like DNA-binding protein